MNMLLYPIIVPILLGVICFAIPRNMRLVRELIALIGSVFTFGFNIWLFSQKPMEWVIDNSIILHLDDLSGFILLACGFFGFFIALYSVKFMYGKDQLSTYYGAFLWTLGAACGVLLVNHLILLLIFWGFLGITLYLFILSGGANAASAAKKSFFIVGGSDALILMGIVLIFSITQTYEINQITLSFDGVLPYFVFILLALGVFAKIGAVPLHTWVPDMAENTPQSATAFLPGSLDKLLGIYLLTRLCLQLTEMSETMNLVLLIIGTLTVIVSVMMGLIQNNSKRLLGYLVITGAGYMIIGFGTGNPTGIAGGLFYMISSALWTSCLFLAIGNVENWTGESEFIKLGGLAKSVPITFMATLIAVFSISGIPPFNGFVSKWMIYQGIIDMGSSGNHVWILWLVVSMFGSALTFAIGAKFIYSVFLGIPSNKIKIDKVHEMGFLMTIPLIILALLCIIFGIFAYSLPIKHFIAPVVENVTYIGVWSPGLATIFIILGLIIGFIIYLLGNLKGIREAKAFIGGEQIPEEERISGIGFYDTVKTIGSFQRFYDWAEAKRFDIYNQMSRLGFGLAKLFQKAHSGILTLYIIWVLVGLTVLFIFLMGR